MEYRENVRETRHFQLLKTASKSCKSSVKARRVLSQALRVDSNQQAKKKRNNTVTREERGNEKGVVKKQERERKNAVYSHEGCYRY